MSQDAAGQLAGSVGGGGGGGKSSKRVVLVGGLVLVLFLGGAFTSLTGTLLLLGGAFGGQESAAQADDGLVPPELIPALVGAGRTCQDVSAPLLAGQVEVESGWDPGAESWTGALGLAQFVPDTWAVWGRDGDGDGVADPLNGADSLTAQAAYLCDLVATARAAVDAGTLTGDPLTLALAGYNLGWAAVLEARTVPFLAQDYINRVLSAQASYLWLEPLAGGTDSGSAIVNAAMQWVGYPYVWGGGTINGPSKIGVDGRGPGFDCSGLVLYAVWHGAGIQLTHLADSQARDGQGVTIPRSFDLMQPGDVIAFSNSNGRIYQHVGIYVGNGQMVHAPVTGKNVQVVQLEGNSYYGGMVWSIRRFS